MDKIRGIEWEGDENSPCLKGTRDGEEVALIHRAKNYADLEDNRWEVEINGTVIEPSFRYLADAQEFAAAQLGL